MRAGRAAELDRLSFRGAALCRVAASPRPGPDSPDGGPGRLESAVVGPLRPRVSAAQILVHLLQAGSADHSEHEEEVSCDGEADQSPSPSRTVGDEARGGAVEGCDAHGVATGNGAEIRCGGRQLARLDDSGGDGRPSSGREGDRPALAGMPETDEGDHRQERVEDVEQVGPQEGRTGFDARLEVEVRARVRQPVGVEDARQHVAQPVLIDGRRRQAADRRDVARRRAGVLPRGPRQVGPGRGERVREDDAHEPATHLPPDASFPAQAEAFRCERGQGDDDRDGHHGRQRHDPCARYGGRQSRRRTPSQAVVHEDARPGPHGGRAGQEGDGVVVDDGGRRRDGGRRQAEERSAEGRHTGGFPGADRQEQSGDSSGDEERRDPSGAGDESGAGYGRDGLPPVSGRGEIEGRMEAVVVLTLQGPFRGVPSGLGRFARGWGDAPDPALHAPAGPVFQARRRQLLAAYGDVPIGDFARVVDVGPFVVPADGRAVADRDGAPDQAEQGQQHGQHAVTSEPRPRSPFEPLPHSGERAFTPCTTWHRRPAVSPPHATSPQAQTVPPPHVRDPSGKAHAGGCGPRISPPVQVRSRGAGRAPATRPSRFRPSTHGFTGLNDTSHRHWPVT